MEMQRAYALSLTGLKSFSEAFVHGNLRGQKPTLPAMFSQEIAGFIPEKLELISRGVAFGGGGLLLDSHDLRRSISLAIST